MSTFLSLLPLELKQVSNFLEPEEEIKQGETVVGDMSNETKALYTLSRYKAKEALDIQAGLMICRENEEEKKAAINAAKARGALLYEILWVYLRDDLNLWNAGRGLALRRGFKVVTYKESPELPPFLKDLLGWG